ncbi:TVP38/TMEM64 family protein [Corynebacterium nuruki]|jgi:uncharacterized membrane protein YdjX (TVP38/TMEM64 family)|uniref:TVP38/TMEM64 family protein n=1 Tax=Corynebacterium nuruki TaxID=1032851 RepID=UPI0039BF4F46
MKPLLRDLVTGWRRLPTSIRLALPTLLVVLVAAGILLPLPDATTLRDGIAATGGWAPLAYLLLMVTVTQLPVPRTVWTVAAGLLFGAWTGSVLALGGLLLSAGLSFLLIRRLGRGLVHSTADLRQIAVLQARLEQRGWISVLGLRMIPAVPFTLLNYACGLSRIPAAPYLTATVAGSAPNTVATVVATDVIVTGGSPWTLGITVVTAALGLGLTVRESRILGRPPAVPPHTPPEVKSTE